MNIDLQQKRILITRAEPGASVFAREIEHLNGIPVVCPVIRTSHLKSSEHAAILSRLTTYDWIMFTSGNGVHYFFKTMKEHGFFQGLGPLQIAVVGTKTNKILREYGYTADFIPSVFNAWTMAREFLGQYHPTKKILIVRGQLSGTILNESFAGHGLSYDCMEVYETRTNFEMRHALQLAVKHNPLDFLTFTSPSTVDGLLALLNHPRDVLGKTVVCIGTSTMARASDRGFKQMLVPHIFTIEAMIQKMHAHIWHKGEEK